METANLERAIEAIRMKANLVREMEYPEIAKGLDQAVRIIEEQIKWEVR